MINDSEHILISVWIDPPKIDIMLLKASKIKLLKCLLVHPSIYIFCSNIRELF